MFITKGPYCTIGSSIVLAVDNALPNTPLVITSGTVDINGRNQTVTALADDTAAGGSSTAGTLSFTGGGTLTVGTTTSSTSTTYAGAITGTGSLVKNGTSTLTLSGNSPLYTGTITATGTRVTFTDCSEVTLVISGGTDYAPDHATGYRNPDADPLARGQPAVDHCQPADGQDRD